MKPNEGPRKGEITSIKDGSIIVNVHGSGVQELNTSRLELAKEKRISVQDISIGQNILAIGKHLPEKRFKAFVIRILKEGRLGGGPKGSGDGPLQGRVSGVNPIKVSTSEADVIVDAAEQVNVFTEVPMGVDELKVGDTLVLIGPPDRIVKVVLAERPMEKKEMGEPRNFQKQDGELKHSSLPVPPAPKASVFDARLMDAKKESPFGFKDAVMLRVDLLSWYDGYADSMRDLGVSWMEPAATFVFSWNEVQRKRPDGTYGPYDWDRFDRLVRNAQANNIQISAVVSAAEPKAGVTGRIAPSLPGDMKGFKAFVSAAVERYDKDGINDMPGLLYPIKRWKVEDEPYSPLFFQGTGGDYAVVLKSAYDSIKSADANADVICAQVYATHGPPGSVESQAFLAEFYSRLSEFAPARPYDIMDTHWIADGKSKFYHLIKNQLILVNQKASSSGFSPAPFNALEVGAISSDEKEQAKNLVKFHAYGFSLGLKKIFWSGIKAVPDSGTTSKGIPLPNDPFRANALIRGDGSKRPAYYSYKKMVEILNGSNWSKAELVKEKDGMYLVKFHSDRPVWVVWNDSGITKKVQIELPSNMSMLKITEAVPSRELGDNTDYRGAFKEEMRRVPGGMLELPLDNDVPMFVEVLK